MQNLKLFLMLIFGFFLNVDHVYAQVAGTPQLGEKIQIIVTSKKFTIEPNFTGTDVYIAGVLENADPLFRRQNRYDIILAVEGPIRPMVLRKKGRKAGIWINTDAIPFKNVPLFYSLATTREMRDITTPDSYRRLGLGIEYLTLRTDTTDKEKIFRDELIQLKTNQNLYKENIGTVVFDSTALFTAKFQLPTNVPVGQYKVYAYLFRDGEFIENVESNLEIVKAHLAYTIYRDAHTYSFLYGVVAALLAIVTGLLGRLIFRKA